MIPDSKPASTLILLGATGDLSQRMLIPSLFALFAEGLLPQNFRLVGAARRAMSDDEFRTFAQEAVSKYLARDRQNSARMADFLTRLHYHNADLDGPGCFGPVGALLGGTEAQDIGVFLSIAPTLFVKAVAALKQAGLAGANVRVAVADLDSDGLPRQWMSRIKRGIRTLGWRFSADRMVMDYVLKAYIPAAGGTSSEVSWF